MNPTLTVRYQPDEHLPNHCFVTLQDAAPSGNLFRLPSPSDLTAEGTCFGHALETYLTRLNEYIAVLQNYRDHVLQTREAYTDAKTVSPSERSIPMLDRVSIHNLVRERLNTLPDFPAKNDFIADVEDLMKLDNDQSLPGITASTWLDMLSDLSDTTFLSYAQSYHKGLLNPWAETRKFTGNPA